MMAHNVNKTQLLRLIATRGFASQANPRQSASNRNEVQVTTLPNKVVVASVDRNAPVSHVSVAYRVGSRNETYNSLGATHVIRQAAALTNKKSTGFGVTRHIQGVGGNLSCETDRESITYNVEVTRDNLDTGLKFLQDVSTQQGFKEWEINDATINIKVDLANVSNEAKAIDLLHRAAFRNTLGNSIFCPNHHVGKISTETLQNFVDKNLRADRAAVVGVGINHSLLVSYAKNLDLQSGSEPNAPAKYISGDVRIDITGNLASVAVATQGAPLTNQKEVLALAVLQLAAGSSCTAEPGNGLLSSVASSALKKPYNLNTLNASYTDNGLFGFVLSGSANEVGPAVKSLVQALKSGNVPSAAVSRAKQQLKVSLLSELDTNSGLVADLRTQALLTGQVLRGAELVAAVDAVSDSDVSAAAKKVANGKWSVGGIGNLGTVPHASEL